MKVYKRGLLWSAVMFTSAELSKIDARAIGAALAVWDFHAESILDKLNAKDEVRLTYSRLKNGNSGYVYLVSNEWLPVMTNEFGIVTP
jgi:hypothetical protein